MPRVRPEFLAGDVRAKSGCPHEGNAMNEGFLGTAAPRYADLVVLLEFGMGVALLIGAVVARTRRSRLHAWCQSAIVLLYQNVSVKHFGTMARNPRGLHRRY
jgi:hypothetical protein